jgi:uroporphyrinogen decarboxylase
MDASSASTRTEDARKKVARVRAALAHREADRIPIGESFWGAFARKWREHFRLPPSTDLYDHYDLDWVVTVPNMDPHVREFQVLRETPEEIVVRTGFEAEIRKIYAAPMPEFVRFSTDTIEKALAFRFDDPWDRRRYRAAGDNQLAGVGDGFERRSPAWIESVRARHPSIAVFGSVCEAQELGWRIIGSENMLLWMGMEPEKIARFLGAVTEFLVEITRAEIAASEGLIDGMVIWGDVAYVRGMLFSPEMWRKLFKPCVARIVELCHAANLPVIYHGCGDARAIYPDLIDVGVDGYNPVEAKAGLDVLELKRQFPRMAWVGNMDVQKWATLPLDELDAYVLRKLEAARGGGFIFQSDHSVPDSVPPERYDRVIRLVRQHGNYPLRLG